jgi:hypothetical protein
MYEREAGQSRLPLILMVLGGLFLVGALITVLTDDDSEGDSAEEEAVASRCAFPACRAAETPALARGFEGPSVDVDPRDPDHIVVTDANMTTAHCTWHVTFDRGVKWKDGVFQDPPGYTGCHINGGAGGHVPTGPEGVAFGPSGTVYATFGSAHTDDGSRESIMLGRSTDGGENFQVTVAARPPGDDVSYGRPQMSVAAGPGGRDRVLISSWLCRERGRFCDQAMFTRSDDGGDTFSAPTIFNDPPAGQTPSAPLQATDGTIYSTFIRRYADGPADLVLARSTDGGNTFAYVPVDSQPLLGDRYDPAKLAMDPNNGAMYLVYTDNRIGRQQVVFRKSMDKGTTWTEPIGIAADQAATGSGRIPTISVAPNGRIDIAYYRTAQADTDDVFWASSIDGGLRFVSRQVNDSPIKRYQYATNIGNWYSPDVVSVENAAIVVWSDTKNADQIANTQDVLMRRMLPAGGEEDPP